jgi:DNA primase
LVEPCPIHHGTNPTQFHVSLTKKNYNCFGDCHGGGNVIDFVAAMEGLDTANPQDLRKAALLLQEWFDLSPSKTQAPPARRVPQTPAAPAPAPVAASPPEPVNPPLKFAFTHLDQEHPYLKERGFTAETIHHFGVGYHAGRGLMHGRVVIPIHNERGELVAYAGRWPGEEPPEGEGKYKLPPNFKKGRVVFNLHRVHDLAQEQGVIIVEGFFDVMWLWQAGMRNGVALMGSAMSEEQERVIVETVGPQGRVALMLDEDAAGWRCREEVLTRLSSHVYVKVIGFGEEGMQPDRLSAADIQRLLR